jgi:hypothetical protein
MALIFSWETIGSIRVLGIVYVFFKSVIVDLCVLPRAPTVSVSNGSTFQPFALMAFMNPWYFLVFSWILSVEYLSLQYVNSINCTVSVELGPVGGFALYGWLRMHNMSGFSLALHWHLCVWLLQMHGSNQFGTVFSWFCPSDLHAFIRM